MSMVCWTEEGKRTDGPLESGHETCHDGCLEDGHSELREDFASEDLECATRLANHVGFPEHTEDISDDRIQHAER